MCLLCQVLKKPAYLPADLRRLPGVYHEGGEISELVISAEYLTQDYDVQTR